MASRELNILVAAKGALKAASEIGKVDSAVGKIGRTAQRGLGTAANNLKRIGLVAAGFVGANVVAGVRSLEDLERVTNLTKGVIESTGGAAGQTAEEIRALSQRLEDLTTADDKAIQSGANMLLTFTNIGGDVFPRATEAVTDLAIAMADGDVENADFSRTAIQVGKALNDPIRGVTALRRVGVQFTKDQEKQIKTMVESGDVVGAQTLILKELEKEFGKAGDAAGEGFGADMRRFRDAVEEGQQALAIGFLPLISETARFLKTEFAKPTTIAAIKDFGTGLAGGLRELISVGRNLPWQQIGDSFRLMGQGAKAALDLFTGLPPWVQTAVLTGWGLNKLSGGALGSIVGELGKGLIRGVLGMTAGVVHAKAGVVHVAGPVAGAPGGGGTNVVPGAKPGGVSAGSVLAGAAILGVGFMIGEGIMDALGGKLTPEEQEGGGRVVGELAGIKVILGNSPAATARALWQRQQASKNVAQLVTPQGMSPDERDEATKTKARLEGLDDRMEGVKAAQERTKIAADRTTSTVERTRGALTQSLATVRSTTAVKGDAIVAAIRNIQLNANITIPLTITGAQRRATVRAQTGTTLTRAGAPRTGGFTEFD